MGRPKLFKFEDLKNFSTVFDRESTMKGKWRSDYFQNDGELILELACGKGEYTRGLAELFPDKNFIGMDVKGNRLWSAAKLGQTAGLTNIAFVRAQIDHIEEFFNEEEIDEIWITFADPFLKPSKWKKRLTSPIFLDHYSKILKPNGLIHLKTDNDVLYEFTKQVIESEGHHLLHDCSDIYANDETHLTHHIQTYYEQMHLKNELTIKYLCFKLKS